jgi:hypothetical protein
MTLTIPAGTAADSYFLLVCADDTDRIDESSERNCVASGQQLAVDQVTVGDRGPAGPLGAPGPKGETGPAGASPDLRQIPRTELEMGPRDVQDAIGPNTGGDPEEGGALVTLMTVGPVVIRGRCVGMATGHGHQAKILVHATSGRVGFVGNHGKRGNLLPGLGTPGSDGNDGGDGAHMFLAASGSPSYAGAFGYVAHSDGTELSLDVWTGIDTFGIAPAGLDNGDTCVFGGLVKVVNAP